MKNKLNLLSPFYRSQDVFGIDQFLAPDNGGGGGGSTKSKRRRRDEDDEEDDEEVRPPRRDATVTAAKYNSDTRVMANKINELEDENFKHRRNIRHLKDDLADANEGRTEGSVVLSKEEATKWEEYKALGEPKVLSGYKTENEDLKLKQKTIEHDNVLREVSNSVEPGIKFDFDVLKDLDGKIVEATYEKKIEKEEGKEVTRWYATYKEGDAKKTIPVLELYKTKFPKFMASLLTTSQEDGDSEDGIEYPEQVSTDTKSGAGTKITGNPAKDYLASEYGHLVASS